MASDMPEPCKFPSLDGCKKGFLWTHKDVDLAPHPVVALVFQVGDAEKSPYAPDFESLRPFFRVSKQGSRFTAVGENGGARDLYSLNLLAKLMVLHR